MSGEPLIAEETLKWLPARWLLRVGTRTLEHLETGQWRPDAGDRSTAVAVRDVLSTDTPGDGQELTDDRLELVSLYTGRLVDTVAMTPVCAELLLAVGQALLPLMPPQLRGAWEPEEPYVPGSMLAIYRSAKRVQAAAVQLLDRIIESPADREPTAPDVPGRSGRAADLRIHRGDRDVSLLELARCPDCNDAEQLLIATDFRRLELTCQRGHTWTDHRVTVSGWAHGPGNQDVFTTLPPTEGIRSLGIVNVRYVAREPE